MNIVVYTRTNWFEPPRLRHQVTELLVSNGHTVYFFERPGIFGKKLRRIKISDQLNLFRGWYLLNPKLTINFPLKKINDLVEKRGILNLLREVDSQIDLVINFNYDSYFIKSIFKSTRIVTIINDDFWTKSLPFTGYYLKYKLKLTCLVSDRVLSVSIPLNLMLSAYCKPLLFLPWTATAYLSPLNSDRNVLLFWGYINSRLNMRLIELILKENLSQSIQIKIRFVGPIEKRMKRRLIDLQKRFGSVEIFESQNLESLYTHDVLAALIPYRTGNSTDDVTTLPNKALHLLSKGLPLLISGMPFFIQEPFVYRTNSHSFSFSLIDLIRMDFFRIQADIQRYLSLNTAELRYRLLLE